MQCPGLTGSEQSKYGRKAQSNKTVRRNKKIDLFTSNEEGIFLWWLEQRDFEEHLDGFVCAVLFLSFTRTSVSLMRLSKAWKCNKRKWQNIGIINPLLDGLTYNTLGHFACCPYFPLNSLNILTYYMLKHPIRWMYSPIALRQAVRTFSTCMSWVKYK